jgi:hypothetical protein
MGTSNHCCFTTNQNDKEINKDQEKFDPMQCSVSRQIGLIISPERWIDIQKESV